MVPLDINDHDGDSDEDDEHPIYGFEGIDDEEDDNDDNNYANNTGKTKFGEPEDEMYLDDDEEEEDQTHILGGRKSQYGADNRDLELQSSDHDARKEEEMAAIQIRKDITKSLTLADYGLVHTSGDEIERDLTLKEASVEEKDKSKWPDVTDITYKEDDMNILHGCKPITFYLLLKPEGQPVHDHPVIANLEDVKKLLDQITQLDETLPLQLEEILKRNHTLEHTVVSAQLLEATVPQEAVEMQKVELTKDNVYDLVNCATPGLLKHQKAVKNRQGQVRNIRKATGSYGGEASGINAGITKASGSRVDVIRWPFNILQKNILC
ncbi:hypothetical protein L6164_026041 [Bauhinia variegata]|uniref:Uncharacterized protein n=1 Tax=Bauhinia variegata TaxID=167791 RepID=A0ACB9M2F6_BAUVA|nr:hypothetical protein L6164_026041 [Bauhinia variegata]